MLTTLLFWQQTGCWEQVEVTWPPMTVTGLHWRPI